MSLDKWQFLDAWNARHYAWRFPKQHSERGCSIAPHASIVIHLKSDDYGEAESSARALELMALAIRVDERVWERLYPADFWKPDGVCEWSQHRPGDLELRVEAHAHSRSSLQYFEPLTVACDADRTGSTSVAAYLDAQRRIAELDVDHRLRGFQIPLTLSLFVEDATKANKCIAWLERLVTSGRVAIRGATNTHNIPNDHGQQRAVYILEAVKILPFTGFYPEVLVDLSARCVDDINSQGLTRLQALGVPITTAVGRVQDDPLYLHWMAHDRALTLALLVKTNAELQRVYTTACRLHERLTSLTLCLSPCGLDVSLAAMVLCELPRVCPSLRSLELIDTFDRGVWVALRDALDAAPLAEASNPVRAFAMVLRRNVLPRHAIPTLALWLPRLESLTVRPYCLYSNPVDDASLGLILREFPRLKAVDLQQINLTTWCDLLDAYDMRGCRIRTLTLGDLGLSCVPLLEALACPTRRISHALRELRIHAALRRLAFLSVVHRAPVRGMLAVDAGVLSLIFALACERYLRLVDVHWE